MATNYELTLRLATVPSERGNDVPSFVSGETKVIKPRGLLDNLAYVPRYVPGLTIVRCWRALRSQPSVGKFIEFLSPLFLSLSPDIFILCETRSSKYPRRVAQFLFASMESVSKNRGHDASFPARRPIYLE